MKSRSRPSGGSLGIASSRDKFPRQVLPCPHILLLETPHRTHDSCARSSAEQRDRIEVSVFGHGSAEVIAAYAMFTYTNGTQQARSAL